MGCGPSSEPSTIEPLDMDYKVKTKDFSHFGYTLEFRIDVGPTVINLAVFSRPYVLIREYIKVI